MKLHYIAIAILSIIVVAFVCMYFANESSANESSSVEGFFDPSLYDTTTTKNLAVNSTATDANYFIVLNQNNNPVVVRDKLGNLWWQQARIPSGYVLDANGQPKSYSPEDRNIASYIAANPTQIKPVPTSGVDAGYFVILNPDRSRTSTEIPIPSGYKLDPDGQPIVMTDAESQQAALSASIGQANSTATLIPSTGLDIGYYNIKNADGTPGTYEAPIPYGYKLDAIGNLVKMTNNELYTQADIAENVNTDWKVTPDPQYKFDTNNYDIEYHNDVTPSTDATDESNGTWVKDPTGKLVFMPWSETDGTITYNQPGTYPYGTSSYVPSYEDSVYLSKLTNEYSTMPIKDSITNAGGFCNAYVNDKSSLEQKCNAIDSDTCASTSCCVLLGGAKCVAGGSSGPTNKSNYGDLTVLNRDFYYYQGKCYGNCV